MAINHDCTLLKFSEVVPVMLTARASGTFASPTALRRAL